MLELKILFAEIFSSIIAAALMTCAGSLWIDKLYLNSAELTFPDEISSRSRFRKPILFCALAVMIYLAENFWLVAAIYLLALMTLTDFEQYMLFDAMTLPLAIIGAIYSWQGNFLDCVTAAAIGGGIFFALAIISQGALGGGDVKLIAALGLWLGSEKLLNVVLVGSIAGGIVAVLMILTKQKDRSSCFAYGPYFALSAIYFLLS